MQKNVSTFIGCGGEYEDAELVIFGAPFDSTTSFRPGARFGCSAIRAESFGLETYSPYQDRDLSEVAVFDAGDLELCFGSPEKALRDIEIFAGTVFSDGKIPCLLGGEHLVTLGAVRAAVKAHPDLRIVHFDAHADLREEYLGERLSHACVLRRCHELLGDGRIYQFGIRSGDRPEFQWARGHVSMTKFGFDGLEDTIRRLSGKPVYLTVDLDVLDPSVFPGTGTPEAGGVDFPTLLRACQKVAAGLPVVGFDLVELCPVYDQSGASTALAGKLLRELLLAVGERK